MYTVACALAIPVTLYMAYIMFRFERESLMVLTKAAAIASIFYFPFANISFLNHWIISTTADIVMGIITSLGFPVQRITFDIMDLNGYTVQIILACTAIQSMALFVGVVGCVRAPADRLFKAFIVSVPVIYLLNLVRDVFVILAYGNQWFQIMPDTVASMTGEPAGYTSFFWAHNVLAELGSVIALVIISYVVIQMLPETITYLRDLFSLVQAKNVKTVLSGREIPAAAPLIRQKGR